MVEQLLTELRLAEAEGARPVRPRAERVAAREDAARRRGEGQGQPRPAAQGARLPGRVRRRPRRSAARGRLQDARADIDVKKRVIRSLAMTGRRGMVFGGFSGDFPMVYGQAMDAGARRARPRARGHRAAADPHRGRTDAGPGRARARAGQDAPTARRAGHAGAPAQPSSTTRSAADRTERDKAREAKAKEAGDALWQLYQGESSVELKREILRNMRFSTQADRLDADREDREQRRAALGRHPGPDVRPLAEDRRDDAGDLPDREGPGRPPPDHRQLLRRTAPPPRSSRWPGRRPTPPSASASSNACR